MLFPSPPPPPPSVPVSAVIDSQRGGGFSSFLFPPCALSRHSNLDNTCIAKTTASVIRCEDLSEERAESGCGGVGGGGGR